MSELSPETEELLAQGRAGTPLSAGRRDELKGAVLAKLATGAVLTTSTSAAAWTMTTKTIGVAVIAAVIGTGTVGVVKYQRQAHDPRAASQSSRAAQTNGVSNAANDLPAPSPTTVAPIAPMTASVNAESPQTIPLAQPTPVANLQTSSTTTSPNSVPAIAHASSPTTTSTISNDTPNTANSPAIMGSSSPNFPNADNTNNGNGSTGVNALAAHPSSLEEEVALLQSAHEALAANDPVRALRLLDEHDARFPVGSMAEDASAERVFAFCAEGNIGAAGAAAGTFLSAHPTGPLAVRVRSSCGGH